MGWKQHSLKTIFTNPPKVRDYPMLKGEVKDLVEFTIKESLKPNPILRIKALDFPKFRSKIQAKHSDNFWLTPWEDILELREAFNEQNIPDVFRIAFGLNEKQLMHIDLFNMFAAYRWIEKQLQEIAEAEKNMLASELTSDEKEAGAEELQELGYTVAVDSIAQGDLLKHKTILKLPYAVIFRKMVLDKKKYDIQKTMQENASRKNRANRK